MHYFYWYLYLLLWFFALLSPNISVKAQERLLGIYCAIWAFVFGFRRYDVGNDTLNYALFFENSGTTGFYGTIDNPDPSFEEGFMALSKFMNFFTNSATFIFLMIGIGVWTFIYYLYKNQSKTPILSLLFMMTITGRVFYTLEIAVRQTISIIVFGFGILFLLKSNIVHWYKIFHSKYALIGFLLCMFSVTIHRTTGLLILLLIFIYFVHLSKFISYVLVGVFTIIAVFSADYFTQLFDGVLLVIEGFSSENVSVLGDRYLGDMETMNYHKSALVAWVIPTLLTIYLSPKSVINTYFFKVFIFTFCLHQLMQFSTLHERLLTPFIILGFTYSIPEICIKNRTIYNLYLLIAFYYVAYIDYKVFMNWPIKIDSAVPYYFIWQ